MGPMGISSMLAAPLSIGQQRNDRVDQIRQNNRQAKIDLLMNIIAIAGGRGPMGMTLNPIAPSVDYAGEMRQVGGDIEGSQGQTGTPKSKTQPSSQAATTAAGNPISYITGPTQGPELWQGAGMTPETAMLLFGA